MAMVSWPARALLFSTFCGLLCAAGAGVGLLRETHRIAEGFFVEQVPVGGLSPEEAIQRVQAELDAPRPTQIRLTFGERSWNLADAKFGRHLLIQEAVDEAYQATRQGNLLARGRARLAALAHGRKIPLRVGDDHAKVEQLLTQLGQVIDREPVDASIAGVVGDRPEFNPERSGYRLRVADSAARIIAEGHYPPPTDVELVVDEVEPTLRVAQLEKELNTVLARFVSNMADGYYGIMKENRAHNVRLLIDRMNGVVLQPGDVWSFNDDLGERKASDGFRASVIFMRRADGTIDEEWITGGGICQLATTIFNAALFANMSIVERSNHSKTVHYARPARDATVYYGVVDLKFRNTLSRPVVMWGELRSNYDLVITFLGDRGDDYDVELDSRTWRGGRGLGGSLWRTVRDSGGQVVANREHICDSFYPDPKPKPKPAPVQAATQAAKPKPKATAKSATAEPAKTAEAPAENATKEG